MWSTLLVTGRRLRGYIRAIGARRMSDLENVTDEERVYCSVCNEAAPRQCHLCERWMCVRHWGPSEHSCSGRPVIKPDKVDGCEEAVMEKAKVIRSKLVEAVMWKDKTKIAKCLANLYNLPPSKQMMAESGLSILLADGSIWRMVDSGLEQKADRLLQLWKKASRSQNAEKLSMDKPWPFRSAADFMEVVDRWQKSLLDAVEISDVTVVSWHAEKGRLGKGRLSICKLDLFFVWFARASSTHEFCGVQNRIRNCCGVGFVHCFRIGEI